MILILSKNQETTTNEVIKWLVAMGKKFIRVHGDEVFEIKTKEKRVYIESQRLNNQCLVQESRIKI
jgi:hypothetical protein